MIDMLQTVHGFTCAYDELDERYACECPDLATFQEKFPPLKVILSDSNSYEIPNYDYTERKNNLCYVNAMALGD